MESILCICEAFYVLFNVPKIIIMHWMLAQKIVHIENLKFVLKMSPPEHLRAYK